MRKPTAVTEVSWPELLELAQHVFGERLTLFILTGQQRPPRGTMADHWRLFETDRVALGTALEIAQGLLGLEAKSTIQAWFVGKNALLDDRSPAMVVRTDPDAVRRAARHFAAYGWCLGSRPPLWNRLKESTRKHFFQLDFSYVRVAAADAAMDGVPLG